MRYVLASTFACVPVILQAYAFLHSLKKTLLYYIII
jgi:hypothetical protein